MTSTLAKSLVCIASALWMVEGGAAGQSYMSLVGELVGKVESLRLLRDHCSSVFPQTMDANKRVYEAWAERNAELLALVRAQREHVDRRLAKQAAADPSAPKSTAEIVVLLEQRLSAQLRGAGLAAQQSFCAKYPDMVVASEKARNEEITALLKTVGHADEILSAREKQP